MKEREDVLLDYEDDTELNIIYKTTTEGSPSVVKKAATEISESVSVENEDSNPQSESPDYEPQEEISPGTSMPELDDHEAKHIDKNAERLNYSFTSDIEPISEATLISGDNEELPISGNKRFKNWKINTGDLKMENADQEGNM